MATRHDFALELEWVGNRGSGTSGYRDYGRQASITAEGKQAIAGSSARVFHGDSDRWNPEELLIAALAECHMLSYLHTAVRHGVTVLEYRDSAVGTMVQEGNGGHFTEVVLRPTIRIADPAQIDLAESLHTEASKDCFIAASVKAFASKGAPALTR